ncbi:Por secretion system C-terminal sorting domain-containing protein [Flavobacterium fluvii]|uniref:Por secretion system C-terminal sorting domain-containing protein n=1 Tax=Flavobacterium fluvii TaxID=468056 RepID=A0A1M5JZI5_9FLAO|nr:T9SS type A sorting domain-containing protein [Flavobacterium fluvii]SHG45971.1 Por secretion system C-terminal sorting domain-containing protein [Flavobacterium fluvii]
MKRILQLSVLLAFSLSYGQTSLFFDNFDPATFPNSVTSNAGFTTSTPTSSVSDAKFTYTGYNSSPAGFYLGSSNGTSGLNCIWNATPQTYSTNLSIQGSTLTYRGTSTVAVPLSSISAPFTPILNTNTNVITWSFGMRINKSTILNVLPGALNSGLGMCGGVILATDAAANLPIATGSSASGYAVILSGDASGTTNRVDFGSFTGGLSYTASPESSTFSSLLTVGNILVGGNSISVTVTYTPSTNAWTLKVRQDGSSSIPDPDATTANSYVTSTPASIVNSSYTGNTMTNMMLFYNHNGSNGIYLDNIRVKTDANLGLSKSQISELKVYPNPVSNGALYINSANNSEKQVVIYNILGQKVLQTKTTSEPINVSSLAKGAYVVKITEDGKSETKKLIVE